MKEKLKNSLHSLKEHLNTAWNAVRRWTAGVWNAGCSQSAKAWNAFRQTAFARWVRKWWLKGWNSGPVKTLRSRTGALLRKISKPRLPQTSLPRPRLMPSERKAHAQEVAASVASEGISTEIIENELRREKFRHRYSGLLRSTIYALIVTAAAAALVATLLLPVLQIYGSSMTPTLHEGDIVVSVKATSYDYGDICSFYYSNRILVKRVIGKPLDRIDIDDDGNVYVNGKLLDEPYIKEKAKGECDIEFPFRVPEGSYFMIGDHRLTSIDSRSSTVGCISREEIVGKILFTVWPPKHMGVKK